MFGCPSISALQFPAINIRIEQRPALNRLAVAQNRIDAKPVGAQHYWIEVDRSSNVIFELRSLVSKLSHIAQGAQIDRVTRRYPRQITLLLRQDVLSNFLKSVQRAGPLLSDGGDTALERAKAVREVMHVRRRHS